MEDLHAPRIDRLVRETVPEVLKAIQVDEAAKLFSNLAPIRNPKGAKLAHGMLMRLLESLGRAEKRATEVCNMPTAPGLEHVAREAGKKRKAQIQEAIAKVSAVTSKVQEYISRREVSLPN